MSRNLVKERSIGEGRHHITCRICFREFQAITHTHLIHAHRYDREHPIEEYQKQFDVARARCLDSLNRVKRGIWRHFERLGRRWTRKRVKGEILEMAKGGHALNSASVTRRRQDLVMAGTHCFGSWAKAIAACGIAYGRIKLLQSWSRGKITRSILKLARSGEELSHSAVQNNVPGLVQAARKWFGKWESALRSAGINPDGERKHRRWTRSGVIRAIRTLSRPLRTHEIQKVDPGLFYAARKHFGKWKAAVMRAGLEYPELYRPPKWPRRKVLEMIRTRARLGLSIKSSVIEMELNGLWSAGAREFGTWCEAVRAAGIAYPKREWSWKWPRDRVLQEIRLRDLRGSTLTTLVVQREAVGLVDAAKRSFGSWASALLAAGVQV